MLLEPEKYAEGLKKYSYIGKMLAGGQEGSVEKGLASLEEVLLRWTELTSMPRLSEYGVKEEHIADIIRGTGNKNNPIMLDDESIQKIIRRRL
jgi:alcohol dehydrogenase class IV